MMEDRSELFGNQEDEQDGLLAQLWESREAETLECLIRVYEKGLEQEAEHLARECGITWDWKPKG